MSKRKQWKPEDMQITVPKIEQVVETETPPSTEPIVVNGTEIEPGLIPRRWQPRECSACVAVRPYSKESYVYVYHTRGTVRYCKCRYCGNTWSQE